MNFGRLIVANILVVVLSAYLLEQRRRRRDHVSDQPNPGPGEMGGNFG
jgi:hypothetical protein